MKVLIIIPAYNEEYNILEVVNIVKRYSKCCKEHKIDYVVINDGSKDNTESICQQNDINYISLIMNLGIGGAVQTGYIIADIQNYDIAVQFDGDGQHDIEYLEKLITPLVQAEADFTVGSRFLGETSKFKSSVTRRIGIKYLSFLIKCLTGVSIKDPTSGFRAANRKVIHLLAENYPIDYPEPESIVTLLRREIKVKEVPVNMYERSGGKSSINFGKSIYYMMKETCAICCAGFVRKGRKE